MATFTLRNRLEVRTHSPSALQALREACTYDNPDRDNIPRLRAAVQARPGDKKLRGALAGAMKAPTQITTWEPIDGGISLARGALSRAIAIVARHDEVEIVDERCDGDPSLGPVRGTLGFTPRDYQRRQVDIALDETQGCWRSPTGSGKTTAAFLFALEVRVPTLVIVWSGALLEQWMRRCTTELGLRPDAVGVIGDGQEKVRALTIGMQQTLLRRGPKYARTFGAVIADELDRFAAKSLYETVGLFEARYRLGVSAEERRKDGKEFLIYDQFGPVLSDISRDELGANVVDVEHRLVPTEFAPAWYLDIPKEARGYAFDQLLDAMTADDARAKVIAQVIASEVRAGQQVLAFAHRRNHVARLEVDVRAELPALRSNETGLMLGGTTDKPEFDRALKGLRSAEVKFAATTYAASGYGLDLPNLSVGVCTTPIYGNRALSKQVQGRFCRSAPGKTGAVLYMPWDRALFGLAPLRASLRQTKVVKVRMPDGSWADGATYLAREVAREREQAEQGGSDDLFTLGGES